MRRGPAEASVHYPDSSIQPDDLVEVLDGNVHADSQRLQNLPSSLSVGNNNAPSFSLDELIIVVPFRLNDFEPL